jgi:hypothetical protein
MSSNFTKIKWPNLGFPHLLPLWWMAKSCNVYYKEKNGVSSQVWNIISFVSLFWPMGYLCTMLVPNALIEFSFWFVQFDMVRSSSRKVHLSPILEFWHHFSCWELKSMSCFALCNEIKNWKGLLLPISCLKNLRVHHA